MLIFIVLLIWTAQMVLSKIIPIGGRNCLACGMVGYCGARPANPYIIRMLLMYNNERGGDSTGWAVNDVITKDTIAVPKFIEKNNLHTSESDSNYTIIAHARKASNLSTRNDKNLAHPFGIFKNGTEKDKYDLVLAMNGTMTNEEEFAEHFGFNWNKYKNSDTEMLAKVMTDLGHKDFIKALEAYDGTATLLFYTPKNKNTILVYKDPQRPMFGWKPEEDMIYLSSLKESFKALGAPDDQIIDFESEFLYKFRLGKEVSKIKVLRDPLKKVVPVKPDYGSTYKGYFGGESASLYSNNDTPNYYELDINAMDKGPDRLYFAFDKYYRQHHPLTGAFFVDDKGNIALTETSKTFNSDMTKRYFIVGYMMKDYASYTKLRDLVFENNQINWMKFANIPSSQLRDYVDYPIMMIGNKEQYWVFPKELQDKHFPRENSIFSFKHFLSEWELTFKMTNHHVLNHKDIKCCKLTHHKRTVNTLEVTKTVYKDVIEGYNIFDVRSFVKRELEADPKITPEALFHRARLCLLKINGKEEIAEWFYTKCVLDFAVNEVSNLHNPMVSEIGDLASRGSWFDYVVQKKLTEVLEKLSKAILAKKEVLKTIPKPPLKEVEGSETIVPFDSLSAGDKIRMAKMNHAVITVKETLEGISKANKFCNDLAFQREMLNPVEPKFLNFAMKYIPAPEIINPETVAFAQAVAFTLNDHDEMTDKEVADLLQKSNEDLCYDMAIKYENHYNENTAPFEGGTKVVTPTGDIEDAEFIEVEEYNPEDLEDELEAAMKITMEGMSEMKQQLFCVSETQRTGRIQHMESVINKHYKEMLQELYTSDTLPQEV